MNGLRIARSIGLIGLVAAALLVCTAQTFQPASKLYRAKPEDVPPWAERGNFRLIRIDGGQIESCKAERTWWVASSAQKKRMCCPADERVICRFRGVGAQSHPERSGLGEVLQRPHDC
jgi:hypothetical protein